MIEPGDLDELEASGIDAVAAPRAHRRGRTPGERDPEQLAVQLDVGLQ